VLAGICGHLREFAPTSRGMCAGCDRCLPCKPQCLRMARSRRGGLEALIDRQADRARGLVKNRLSCQATVSQARSRRLAGNSMAFSTGATLVHPRLSHHEIVIRL
jgi:Na+-translocating ferredoxin:NAD+ oxidoreductase RNF subunit RnfB